MVFLALSYFSLYKCKFIFRNYVERGGRLSLSRKFIKTLARKMLNSLEASKRFEFKLKTLCFLLLSLNLIFLSSLCPTLKFVSLSFCK